MCVKKQMLVAVLILILDVFLGVGVVSVAKECVVTGQEEADQVVTNQVVKDQAVVALTFDDGPNEEYTSRLLDGLRERGVKATFFLIGECVTGREALVRRIDEEGHLIGVHCMQHTQLTKMPVEAAVRELRTAKDIIEEIIQKEEKIHRTINKLEYMRPPFGAWSEALDEAVRTELGMEPVFWDVDSLDWKVQNTGRVTRQVLGAVKNGDIILMHDEFGSSVEAAFQIIDNLRAKGYTFVTVNELMVD